MSWYSPLKNDVTLSDIVVDGELSPPEICTSNVQPDPAGGTPAPVTASRPI